MQTRLPFAFGPGCPVDIVEGRRYREVLEHLGLRCFAYNPSKGAVPCGMFAWLGSQALESGATRCGAHSRVGIGERIALLVGGNGQS